MSDDKKTKLPKRIAGVKLPKKVRRKANKALGALDQPLIRNLASVALAAVTAAAAKHADGAEDAKARPDTPAGAKPSAAAGHFGEIAAGLAMAAVAKWLTTATAEAEKAPESPAEPAAKPRPTKSPNGAALSKP